MQRRLGLGAPLGLGFLLVIGVPGAVSSQSGPQADLPGKGADAEPALGEAAAAPSAYELIAAEGAPNGRAPDRDPFALGGRAAGDGSGLRFTRQAGTSLPVLRLRGIVHGHDGSRVGLLQIGEEGVYMVRAGDTISLWMNQAAGNAVINIREINQLTLVVESGTLGEVIIVR